MATPMNNIILRNQGGTVFTETACIVALIAVAALASLGFLGNSVKQSITNVGNNLNNSISPAGGPGAREQIRGRLPVGGGGSISPGGGGIDGTFGAGGYGEDPTEINENRDK